MAHATPTASTGKGTKRKRVNGEGRASSSSDTSTPKRVFISYSMDPYIDQSRTPLQRSTDVEEQRRKVKLLADRLRDDGVESWIDQYYEYNPPQLWTRWMEEEIVKADYVLMICSPNYKECVMGERNEEAVSGYGVRFEGKVIYSLLSKPQNHGKFLPVFFGPIERDHVPDVFGGANFFGPIETPPTLEGEYLKLLSKILGRNPPGQGPPPVRQPAF